MRTLIVITALLLAPGMAQAEVTFDWIVVGDLGNPGDTEIMNDGTSGYGSVGYYYRIGKHEVTNAQYAEFLNAVAVTDTYGLYGNMGSGYGGITRSGSPGGYTYSAIAGRENMPVNWVSFYDSLRFANWLHNGQPTGAQDSTTTEDGAYTMITESYPDGPFITRNTGAKVFLPSEDESYKAAFYDPVSNTYFNYPAGSDTPTTCAAPGATDNTANCNLVVGNLTNVGSYTDSASAYGTFDQGGNVKEWNEGILDSNRGNRGGTFASSPDSLAAWSRSGRVPTTEYYTVGFRVASVPGGWAPPVPTLAPWSQLALVAGMLLAGMSVWRWRA